MHLTRFSIRRSLVALVRDESIVQPLLAFAVSRVLIVTIILVTVQFKATTSALDIPTLSPSITLRMPDIVAGMRKVASANDAYWYATIAQDGYEQRPFDAASQHNWAFFPLYPLLWRFAATITGQFWLSGVLLSNGLFSIALVMLYRLVVLYGEDAATARQTVVYVALFPTSYFFSLPWTESLFLALSVSTIYAARRDAWWIAGLLGALTTATRFSGVLLLPTLVIMYWQRYGWRFHRRLLVLCVVPLGLGLFMLHLTIQTGNPLAFADVLDAWDRRPGFFWTPLLNYLIHPSQIIGPWNFKLVHGALALLSAVCCVVLFWQRNWHLAVYTLLSVIIPLSTTTLQSFGRYSMVIFPLFMLLGQAGRSAWIDLLIRTVFVALLTAMTMLFVLGYTMAGA